MAKAPPKEKPKPLEILKVRMTKTVSIAYNKGPSFFDLDEPDNPHPRFLKSLAALADLYPIILHLPEKYFAENFRVIGYDIGSLGGALTVSIVGFKSLDDASKQFEMKTPPRLLENPKEEGSYSPPLKPKHAEYVWRCIEHAKEYVNEERAQGVIVFEDPHKKPEPAEGEELPLGDAAAASPEEKK